MRLIICPQIKGITEHIYGTFNEGTGDVIPASSKGRTFRVKFRSNRRKTGGGFRCQVGLLSLYTTTITRSLLFLQQLEVETLPELAPAPALERGEVPKQGGVLFTGTSQAFV